MKVRCNIDGLHCPHCAINLSDLLKKHDAISDANINYPMKSLVLDVAEDADEEEIAQIAQQIADSYEEGISIELRD